uniref:Uncharacterized protein n=1 Tax=Arundo donax TaxID=35708 RepID=A0A0A9GK14_ARUDO
MHPPRLPIGDSLICILRRRQRELRHRVLRRRARTRVPLLPLLVLPLPPPRWLGVGEWERCLLR